MTSEKKEHGLIVSLVLLVTVLIRLVFIQALLRPTRLTVILGGKIFLVFLASHNVKGIIVVLILAAALQALSRWTPYKELGHRYTVRRQIANDMRDFFGPGMSEQESAKEALRFIKVTKTGMLGNYRVTIRTPRGRTDSDVMNLLPSVAAELQTVRFIPVDDDPRAGVVSVLFCFIDPLESHLDSEYAPVLHLSESEKENPYLWLPVGIDATGEDYKLPLFLEENGSVRTLHQGVSGSGKSSIVNQQFLQAAQNPFIDLYIYDGKGKNTEFGFYAPYCLDYSYDKSGFFNQLRLLEAEIARRSEILGQNKMSQKNRFSDSWNHYDDGNFALWGVDELGALMGGLGYKDAEELSGRIYGIVATCRSLGIAVIFSTQSFRSDVLSTKIRDNAFDAAVGFKSMTVQESEYIGFSSSDEVRPDLIRGKMLESGRSSSVGQFASRGLAANNYGKSYYISRSDIRDLLSSVPEPEKESADI